jgi:hypothetical protein
MNPPINGQGFPSAHPRSDTPVDGFLTAGDGQPLEGVHVAGSLGGCCPLTADSADTDENGHFHLNHPGTVLHFSRPDLRPQALVLADADSTVHVALERSEDNLVTRDCNKSTQRDEKISGQWLRLAVPKTTMRIDGGETDVDYRRYVIRPSGGDSVLELWFGSYAMGGTPADDMFVGSTTFRQRFVLTSKAEIVGVDSWGTLKNGAHWRQMAVVAEGAIYRNATAKDAALFDAIINGACTKGL